MREARGHPRTQPAGGGANGPPTTIVIKADPFALLEESNQKASLAAQLTDACGMLEVSLEALRPPLEMATAAGRPWTR